MAINKRLLAKRDMNFFAEFTANAAKMRRLFGYAVVIGVIVVGVLLASVGYDLIRNFFIKEEITSLEVVLNSEEYSTLEDKAKELTRILEERQKTFYTLTQMRKQVDTSGTAPVELPDILAKSIPSDTYVESYEINTSSSTIIGYSFSYYSVVDMVHKLNESNVFTTVPQCEIQTFDPTNIGGADSFVNDDLEPTNLINNYYQYTISGTLLAEVYISIGRYTTGDVSQSLSGIETKPVKIGNPYEITDIATYETGGNKYTLNSITVNNVAVTANNLATIIANNKIQGTAYENLEIKLMYDKVVETTAEGTQGGEGK